MRVIIAQAAEDIGVRIVNVVLSSDHVRIMAEIPPNISVSEFVKVAKGRSSRKIQQEFPEIGKKYWGRHFWGSGFFSSTSGHVTDGIINNHSDAHRSDNVMNISLE